MRRFGVDLAWSAGTRKAAGSLIVSGGAVALSFLNVAILARLLGPSGLGVYSLALAVVMVFASTAYSGLSALIVRETAAAAGIKDRLRLRGILKAGFAAGVVMAAAASVLLGAAIGLLHPLWTEERQHTFMWSVVLLLLLALLAVLSSSVRGLDHPVAGQLSESVVRPGAMCILLGWFWYYSSNPLDPPTAMALHVVATAIALVTSACIFFVFSPRDLPNSPARPLREWNWALLQLSGVFGLSTLAGNIDLLVVAALLGDTTAGVYRVVAQGVLMITVAVAALFTVLQPQIAGLLAEGRHTELQRRITITSRVASGLVLVALLAAIALGASLLELAFGPAYKSGAQALAILAAGQLSYGLFGPAIHILNMSGNERASIAGLLLALVVVLLSALALVPSLGMSGAAISSACGLAAGQAYLAHRAHQLTGLRSIAV